MTREPTEEMVEAGARGIAVAKGQDPDGFDIMLICDADDNPLPLWMFYEEEARAALKAALAREALSRPEPVAVSEEKQCDRCQGNGEIVTDWDRYIHPRQGDVGDEAVTECPDCSGTGRLSASPSPPASEREKIIEKAWPDLNVTDEELLRIRNMAEAKSDGQVKIWGKMLAKIVDHVRAIRALSGNTNGR